MQYIYAVGADTTVTKRLACMNNGIFYSLSDSAGLGTVMSSYYTYFAAAVTDKRARWVLYDDIVTGTELLSACAPMYDNTDTNGLISVIMGVLCMDMNIIESLTQLRARSDWNDLYSRVVADTDECSDMWVGLDEVQTYEAIEYIRSNAASDGAETCDCDYGACEERAVYPWWLVVLWIVFSGAGILYCFVRCINPSNIEPQVPVEVQAKPQIQAKNVNYPQPPEYSSIYVPQQQQYQQASMYVPQQQQYQQVVAMVQSAEL